MPLNTLTHEQKVKKADGRQWDDNIQFCDGCAFLCAGKLPLSQEWIETQGPMGEKLQKINQLQKDLVYSALGTCAGTSVMMKEVDSKLFRQHLECEFFDEYEKSLRRLLRESRFEALRKLPTQTVKSVTTLHRYVVETLLELDDEEEDIALSSFPPVLDAAYTEWTANALNSLTST